MENKIIVFNNIVLERVQRNMRYALIISAVSVCVLLADIVITILLYTSENYVFFMTLTVIMSLVAGWIVLYQMLENYLPNRKQLSLMKRVNGAKMHVYEGTVTAIDPSTVTIQGLLCNKVDILLEDQRRKVFYLFAGSNLEGFQLHRKTSVEVYDLFITSFCSEDSS